MAKQLLSSILSDSVLVIYATSAPTKETVFRSVLVAKKRVHSDLIVYRCKILRVFYHPEGSDHR